jgi:hypothetical protein
VNTPKNIKRGRRMIGVSLLCGRHDMDMTGQLGTKKVKIIIISVEN